MKTSLKIFVFACALVVWQGCGSKSNETTDDTSVAEVSAETQEENSIAKQARLEKERADRAEQRRLAAIEKAKASPSYTDAMGKLIYNKAEIDPAYPGGNAAMMKYLNDNISYPKAARDNGIEGTMFVDFVVDENGNVTDVTVLDFVGDEDRALKDEAIRLVKSMPKWLAGTQHGKTVSATFSIPITFQLTN